MAKGQGNQNQQPQIPSLELEATASGRLIHVSVQARLGNKPNGNQEVKIFLRKVGGNWVDTNQSAITDPSTGRAIFTIPVSSAGLHEVQAQAGLTKVSATVEIPKDPEPKFMVYPMRTGNEVAFLITGKPGETIVYNLGNGSLARPLNKDGILGLVIDLSDGEEHEVYIYSPGPKKRVYRGTFFRYDARQIGNHPFFTVAAGLLAFFWSLFFLVPSATVAMPMSLVLGLQVIIFLFYAYIATKTRFNNIMALVLVALALISLFSAMFHEVGQNPFSWLINSLLEHSEYLRNAARFPPEPYIGVGSWIWWMLAPLFVLESFFFIPFFSWDEAVLFVRKQAERWSQRPFCMNEEEKPKVVAAASEGNKQEESGNFWARTWDKFDEAIIASVGWDVVYKLITKRI